MTGEANQERAAEATAPARPALSFAELVAFTAAVMALNALAIDMMLPALGIIGDALGAAHDNDRQLVIVVYVLGNGFAQLVFGPLVDRFGRRRVLLIALAAYIAGSALSIFAASFSLLLAARAFQGVATAACRVSAIAIVRDLCSGRRMAEVMSLTMTVLMAAPILAPGFGQLVLFAAPWRGIFVALLFYGVVLMLWARMRIPETLPVHKRSSLDLRHICGAFGEFFANRAAMGYSLAAAFVYGALFSYVSASEQIFLETFALGEFFPLAFAGVAISFAAASLLNARLVGQFGMRRIAHTAMVGFVVVNLIHLAIISSTGETLTIFLLFTGLSFFALGLIAPNATALALSPVGHIAGAAAAANGFASTTIAGFLGGAVARFYDGTTLPIIMGFVCLGLSALAMTLWIERGVLFKSAPDTAREMA